MRHRVTDQEAAVAVVRAALLDIRGSAHRRQLLTTGAPATDDGDYVSHMQAVAAVSVDLPALIADPSARSNGQTLGEHLALLAAGDDPRSRWVRTVFADIGYEPSTVT
jgi:hypothetical protein